jgi:hypothetical protein
MFWYPYFQSVSVIIKMSKFWLLLMVRYWKSINICSVFIFAIYKVIKKSQNAILVKNSIDMNLLLEIKEM